MGLDHKYMRITPFLKLVPWRKGLRPMLLILLLLPLHLCILFLLDALMLRMRGGQSPLLHGRRATGFAKVIRHNGNNPQVYFMTSCPGDHEIETRLPKTMGHQNIYLQTHDFINIRRC